ncbi:MAG: bifunctional phosphoribosylaminoimidazolecarboxamide formyltransferase/inosine monophosphate cyclohydrolase [Actinobacteria bacterium RBG_16_70_17]|nr:MAG: bifunctional phosphoribosylaminoimidazolecarboxamide formyltransferase/inosine monophosphate cyclohydrolase [Actinobacteria bacterium RBG_16_70_17]
MPIRRALLSVTDKTGVVELARALAAQGCELISTGGTRAALEAAGLPVTEAAAVSGNPEAFGGRMKTISFAIESALLYDRERDAGEAAALGIRPIDLVACNLYPFREHADAGEPLEALMEQVDIGGPTMIRAAAKNHRWAAVLTSPTQYAGVIAELAAGAGALSPATRERLMREAFNHTADYDAAIAQAVDQRLGAHSLRLAFERGRPLRYGENPHQGAWLLRERSAPVSLADAEVLSGKEISHNNLVDLVAALEAVQDLPAEACAVVKHANPCGLAVAPDQRAALAAAWEGDPVSAFGSVIAFNTPVRADTVGFFDLGHPDRARRRFVEVVAAPGFTDDALEGLKVHSNLRVVQVDPAALRPRLTFRSLPGACLLQEADTTLEAGFAVQTRVSPAVDDPDLVRLGLVATRQVKSNAIAVVRRRPDGVLQLLGAGGGQPNRLDSIRLAVGRCRDNLAREYRGPEEGREDYIRSVLGSAILVSDAFFPFPDNVEGAAAAGIKTMYEPGGSMRDAKVVERADELGVCVVFTGIRHFKH